MSDEITGHVVRLRDDATGWRQVGGPRLDEDDPFLTGLGEVEAERLVQSNWALRRSSADEAQAFYGHSPDEEADSGEDESEVSDDAAEDAESEDTTESESADVETGSDWNEDDWLDHDYQQRAEDVREGRVDDHLEEIIEIETSETVREAATERRSEVTDGVL